MGAIHIPGRAEKGVFGLHIHTIPYIGSYPTDMQLKKSNQLSLPRLDNRKTGKDSKLCIIKQRPTQSPPPPPIKKNNKKQIKTKKKQTHKQCEIEYWCVCQQGMPTTQGFSLYILGLSNSLLLIFRSILTNFSPLTKVF